MSPEPRGDGLLQSGHRPGRCGLGTVELGQHVKRGGQDFCLLSPPLIPSVLLQLMCKRKARRTSGWESVFGARDPGARLS